MISRYLVNFSTYRNTVTYPGYINTVNNVLVLPYIQLPYGSYSNAQRRLDKAEDMVL